MKFQNKKMPLREVSFSGVQLIGHRAVRLKFYYTVESKKVTTFCEQEFEISFCSMRSMGKSFHRILDELSGLWHAAKSDISGEAR